jgi:putative RNA 2'-phosphotransferase
MRQSRQHVHLTLDVGTALKAGQRHGKPVLFEVVAKRMHEDGYAFYLSANGVWLTGSVPAAYLKLLQQQDEIF